MRAAEFDRDWLRGHLADERRKASLLGEIREAIFGAQDGLVSTLAVVSTVSGATDDRFTVLIAGIATGLAGVFSMAAGEYLSSKSQREISLAKIADEREKVAARRADVQADLAYLLGEDGLPDDEARRVAEIMARHPEVLLTALVDYPGLLDRAITPDTLRRKALLSGDILVVLDFRCIRLGMPHRFC